MNTRGNGQANPLRVRASTIGNLSAGTRHFTEAPVVTDASAATEEYLRDASSTFRWRFDCGTRRRAG